MSTLFPSLMNWMTVSVMPNNYQIDETDLELQMIEIEKDLIVYACEQREQKYAIITVDDFIIPPDDFT